MKGLFLRRSAGNFIHAGYFHGKREEDQNGAVCRKTEPGERMTHRAPITGQRRAAEKHADECHAERHENREDQRENKGGQQELRECHRVFSYVENGLGVALFDEWCNILQHPRMLHMNIGETITVALARRRGAPSSADMFRDSLLNVFQGKKN